MSNQSTSNLETIKVMPSIDENLLFIKNILGESIGLKEWKFKILGENIEIGIAYIESICDKELVRQYIVDPLQNKSLNLNSSEYDIADAMQAFYLSSVNIRKANMMKELIDELLKGNTLLFFNNTEEALVVKSRKIEKRSISAPENEATVLSSRESFIEDIETNSSMIIKRLPISELQFETFTVGKLSRTSSKLIWIEGISNCKLLDEIRNRINNIDIDMVDGVGVLAELIKDKGT